MPLLRRLRLLLPAAVFVAMAWAGFSQPASATFVSGTEVTSVTIDGTTATDGTFMFDIEFRLEGQALFDAFCQGCSLTGAQKTNIVDNLSLVGLTWWTLTSFDGDGTGGDSAVFTVDVSNESVNGTGLTIGIIFHSFGYSTNPDSVSAEDSGDWGITNTDINLGGVTVETCLFQDVGDSCVGGSGGLLPGESSTFQITITAADFSGGLTIGDPTAGKIKTDLATVFGLTSCTKTITTNCGQDSYEPVGKMFVEDITIEVPEPASLLLYGIGLLGLGVFARRRRFAA